MMIKSILLPSGEQVPAMGMGTWNMGDHPSLREEEMAALRFGLDLGALEHVLNPSQRSELDQLFPLSPGPGPLEML